MRLALLLVAAIPALGGEFTTALGDAYPYTVSAIATDSAGNTYIVGSRQLGGSGLSIVGVIGATPPVVRSPYFAYAGTDVFVSKLDPNGKLLFTKTFAGKGVDTGTAITVDPSGNIYIAGTTTSDDFPLSKALQTQSYAGGTGFIVKLSGDGSTILYSTYFGGALGATSITALATDAKGNLYLTGYTSSSDFPHTAGMPAGQVNSSKTGAIISSISAAGDKILYSGVISGGALACSGGSTCFLANLSASTGGVGIALDAAGNAYIAGNTNTTDLPTTPNTLSPKGIGAFVARVNVGGSGLGYLTYLGSGVSGTAPYIFADNTLRAIAVDAVGNAYLAGQTNDPKFPATPGSFQPVFNGLAPPDGFVAKLKPDGSAMVWATYLGSGDDGGTAAAVQSLAISPGGNIWVTGVAGSSTIPNTSGWTTGTAFVAGLNATASQLTYSALFPSGTVEQSIAVDASGQVHVAGSSGSVAAISPASAPTMKIFALQNAAGGSVTARISPAEAISIYGPGIGPAAATTAAPANGFYPKTLAGVQVTINGMNMPLLYVSANQINAVVPMGIAPGAAATIRVINGAAISPDYPVWLVASAPQAFAIVINQDGSINSYTNSAKFNSVVTFYVTGFQSNFSPLADGQVATAAQNMCIPCTAMVQTAGYPWGGTTVTYGGEAPGIVAGISQFNVNVGAGPGAILADYLFLIAGPSFSFTKQVWVN